jgi:hypothetical protein
MLARPDPENLFRQSGSPLTRPGIPPSANKITSAAIDYDPAWGVDAGDEDRCRAGGAIGVHRDLDDLIKRGVGDEQGRTGVVERHTVGPKGRRETGAGAQQRIKP